MMQLILPAFDRSDMSGPVLSAGGVLSGSGPALAEQR